MSHVRSLRQNRAKRVVQQRAVVENPENRERQFSWLEFWKAFPGVPVRACRRKYLFLHLDPRFVMLRTIATLKRVMVGFVPVQIFTTREKFRSLSKPSSVLHLKEESTFICYSLLMVSAQIRGKLLVDSSWRDSHNRQDQVLASENLNVHFRTQSREYECRMFAQGFGKLMIDPVFKEILAIGKAFA
jgi:hypothetical protein